MRRFAVAVDGPAGSGKSTVAKAIAKELGIIYVDTGAMYRTVAYDCIQKGADLSREEEVAACLEEMKMEILPEKGGQRILLNGEDITTKIRTPEIGKGASQVAVYGSVRNHLTRLQQQLAAEHSVIMDGRDIGTVVLPQAEVKIYLDAGVEERARRRVGELEQQGRTADLETVKKEIQARDENDMNRALNPLRCAEDAVRLDSTGLGIEEVKEKILSYIAEKIKE